MCKCVSLCSCVNVCVCVLIVMRSQKNVFNGHFYLQTVIFPPLAVCFFYEGAKRFFCVCVCVCEKGNGKGVREKDTSYQRMTPVYPINQTLDYKRTNNSHSWCCPPDGTPSSTFLRLIDELESAGETIVM